MGTHIVSDLMLGYGAEASAFKKFQREANAQQQRDGDGGKREEKRDLRVASGSGSGNCAGGLSELCDVDCASFEQQMLFWQNVAVDKSEHIGVGDRRLAKDVCHEKALCDVGSSAKIALHHIDTSHTACAATATTFASAGPRVAPPCDDDNDNKRQQRQQTTHR